MSIHDIALKVKVISANSFAATMRAAAFTGILAAVVLPFILLTVGGRGASHLPWYVWTIILLLLVLVVSRGRNRFLVNSHEAEAISISSHDH